MNGCSCVLLLGFRVSYGFTDNGLIKRICSLNTLKCGFHTECRGTILTAKSKGRMLSKTVELVDFI